MQTIDNMVTAALLGVGQLLPSPRHLPPPEIDICPYTVPDPNLNLIINPNRHLTLITSTVTLNNNPIYNSKF